MKTKYAIFFAALLLPIVSTADDTEIYLGYDIDEDSIPPNVLFIIDSSGSMDGIIEVEGGPYDPAVTYDGSCSSSYYYWKADWDDGVPTCDTSNKIRVADYVCDAGITAMASAGLYPGRHSQYRVTDVSEPYWEDPDNNYEETIECQDDFGVHGSGSPPLSHNYPADDVDGGPFIGSEPQAFTYGINYSDPLIVYLANYLNWYHNYRDPADMTRLQIVQSVFTDIMNTTSGINAGLMRFDQDGSGGYFLEAVQALTDTSRATLKTKANAIDHDGNTPLSETLYEAALYFMGGTVDYGDSSDPGTNNPNALSEDDATKYDPPIDFYCQKNVIILLTDGEPIYDYQANAKIKALPGFDSLADHSCDGTTSTRNPTDSCLDELADYLANTDISDLEGDQFVQTYTIGFSDDAADIDTDLMEETATKGDGRFFFTDNLTGLGDVFSTILLEVTSDESTFVAPSVPVNSFNRLTHDDALVFALFLPAARPNWTGNLKRYKLSADGEIIDANDAAAVDAETGLFKESARSIWTTASDGADGPNTAAGGAASHLGTARNVYTNIDPTASNVLLSATANAIHEDNSSLTKAILGISTETDAYRTDLVKWMRGVDVLDEDSDDDTTDARKAMGDPLHNTPVTVNYGRSGTDTVDSTVFFSTNEGYLHAINLTSGAEHFAFMPYDLLSMQNSLYENAITTAHPYGLDGLITPWVNDANNNGVVLNADGTVETGEHVYLYMGMRRGGRNIYALDVSNRAAPRLKWVAYGGTGDFANLGQTWGPVVKGRIKLGGTERDVVFASGGYDPAEDGMDYPTGASQGNSIYIIDASTGARIWWAGSTDSGASLELANMNHSIPGGVSAIDSDGDGLVEMFYAADTGGQIWRFDLSETATTASGLATGARIASLAATNQANARRFYYAPDISVVHRNSGVQFAIAIGSGYRAHPLDSATTNRFYVLFDPNIYSAPATYPTLSTLVDVTTDTSGTGLSTADGWHITLRSGEHVLAESRTLDDTTLFTTYTPGSIDSSVCAMPIGTGRIYAVNTKDGTTAFSLSTAELEELSELDKRMKVLKRGGIPPEPGLIFPPDGGSPRTVVGTEVVDEVELENPLRRLNWKAE